MFNRKVRMALAPLMVLNVLCSFSLMQEVRAEAGSTRGEAGTTREASDSVKSDKHQKSDGERAAKPEKKPRGCSANIVIKAKPEQVYNAIMKLRDDSQDTVKELSKEGNHCILEEKFDSLPIIGEATCVYKETYTPFKSIEYHMIRSDKFQAFEGCWFLAPTEDGSGTNVSLSSYVVCDIPVPFAKQLCKIQTMLGVKQRLHEVKKACEKRKVTMK